MKYFLTGGAGFIGSAVVRQLINHTEHSVCNVDALTYAGNLSSLESVAEDRRYTFVQADIRDGTRMAELIEREQPDVILHLAAESHVDRSIEGPAEFIETNILGTYQLLEAALSYWKRLPENKQERFRFQHISTDEVYGTLGPTGKFTEETPYRPNSPYASSKAGSDHLVRAWGETYGLPVVITNCSNNYGPYQFPEKLIPLMIINGLEGKSLPVYGKGVNVRDWLYVEDHAAALIMISERARPGSTYNIGGDAERRNIEVVKAICSCLDAARPGNLRHERLIEFVTDRPGHDARYAIDATRIKDELGWSPSVSFDSGLQITVDWYLKNNAWWQAIREKKYSGERLGVSRNT